jgi:hypothetical protein
MEQIPSTTVANGRDGNGRFVNGNRLAKGNPNAKRAQKLRTELMKSVEGDDLKRIVKSLVNAAVDGDVSAAKLILDRVLGPPVAVDFEQRLSELEELSKGLGR